MFSRKLTWLLLALLILGLSKLVFSPQVYIEPDPLAPEPPNSWLFHHPPKAWVMQMLMHVDESIKIEKDQLSSDHTRIIWHPTQNDTPEEWFYLLKNTRLINIKSERYKGLQTEVTIFRGWKFDGTLWSHVPHPYSIGQAKQRYFGLPDPSTEQVLQLLEQARIDIPSIKLLSKPEKIHLLSEVKFPRDKDYATPTLEFPITFSFNAEIAEFSPEGYRAVQSTLTMRTMLSFSENGDKWYVSNNAKLIDKISHFSEPITQEALDTKQKEVQKWYRSY